MTVSYTGDVANASSFGCFNKILWKWKGSVYKLIYKELLAYISTYFIINIIYRFVLIANTECGESDDNETDYKYNISSIENNITSSIEHNNDCNWYKQQRENFEGLVKFCKNQASSIPLTFVLGFYVNVIVTRWWNQYQLLPWPDNAAIYTMTFIEGKDERGRLMRRNIIRYVLLAYCMAIRRVSFRVKKRFPDLQHLVDAGLMREDELKVIQSMNTEVTVSKWFLPLAWAADITARALAENRIRPQTINTVVKELGMIRENLTSIINYDWVSVPLVYTQVVTIAVYSYFSAALIGNQWIQDHTIKNPPIDLYYPFFLTLQFVFYVGWLKVAETLINPFGEDDDDFELNRLIDRHIQVGFLIVENEETPELLKDRYWDEIIPKEIPYTVAAEKFKKGEFVGSAEQTVHLADCDKEYGYVYSAGNGQTLAGMDHRYSRNRTGLSNDHYDMGDYGDYESVGTPMPSNKLGWIKRKLSGMGSIGRNSISSNSTYIYGKNNNQKSFRKSQLSLYNQITRRLSLKDNAFINSHLHAGRAERRQSRVNRTPRKRSLSDCSDNGGIRNEGFEKEVIDEPEDSIADSDQEPVYIRSHLDTITENQNSPYSTQVSHSVSRRMSAQSIFAGDGDRRANSVAREPFVEPVIELFHENEEMEAKLHKLGINRSRSASLGTESSTSDKSKASNNRESGVESWTGEVIPEDEEVTGVGAGGINIDSKDDNEFIDAHMGACAINIDSDNDFHGENDNDNDGRAIEADCEGSPSPQLPRRKAVMSMRKIEDSSNLGSMVCNIDSPFESFPSVYV